jgi:hypothetical protein
MDRLQEAIGLGLVLGIVHGLLQPAYSVPVVPNFTQGSMTSHTETTSTVTGEVVPGQQNLPPLHLRPVQHEVRVWRAVRQVTPVGKEMIPHPGLVRGFQKPRRYDLIRVYVVDEQRNNLAL